MKPRLADLGLAVSAVLIFLLACEGVLWIVAPPPKVGLSKGMMILRDGMWQITPGFAGMMDNRVDFRDKRITGDEHGRRVVPAAPARAVSHVFAIGDSQTFGHGLADEETWPNQLQLALGDAVKVENHAVPAINVDQYVRKFDHLLPRLSAGDTVIVGLTWNDLITQQDVSADDIRLIGGYLVKAGEESEQAQARRIALYERTGVFIPPLSDVKGMIESLANVSALAHFLYPRAKALYYRLRERQPVNDLIALGVPEFNLLFLAKIRDKAEKLGARFVVVLLPDRIFFEDRSWLVYSAGGRAFPAQNLMGHLALPLCERFLLSCLDPFALLNAHQNDPVAFVEDGHYNETGARLLGQWIARHVGP